MQLQYPEESHLLQAVVEGSLNSGSSPSSRGHKHPPILSVPHLSGEKHSCAWTGQAAAGTGKKSRGSGVLATLIIKVPVALTQLLVRRITHNKAALEIPQYNSQIVYSFKSQKMGLYDVIQNLMSLQQLQSSVKRRLGNLFSVCRAPSSLTSTWWLAFQTEKGLSREKPASGM